MHAPTEVSQLDHTKAVEQVLRLDVPMNNVLRVDVSERLADLEDVARGLDFVIPALRLAFKVFVELTLGTILQDQVYPVIVVEEAVQLNHILVPQVALNFDLSAQLVRYVTLE